MKEWNDLKKYLETGARFYPRLRQMIDAVDNLFTPTPRHEGDGYPLNREEISYFCATSAKRTAAEWSEFWGCSISTAETRARQYGVEVRMKVLRWDVTGKEYLLDCADTKTAKEWAELFGVSQATIYTYAFANDIECRRLRKTAPRRRWTSQEDEIMRESGLTAAVMSGLFDRSVAAVEKHARDLHA